MANRKVLINRHSTKNQAPVVNEMFLGEIAVSHPSAVSETTIWTRNDNVMVPFASCAMTMQMIDDSYNVLSGAIEDVLSIITTSITGDSIIGVQPSTSGAGTYNLSHKEATAVTGFNKLSTDAYGHVTASTAVEAADIKALGFEDSAWTEEKIASAITALDSATAVTAGKYMTGIAIADGMISGITEENLPTLSVESAGTGNVVSQITVNDHEITYQTVSVATSEDIQALSAAVISFSAETVAEFTSAFTAINNLSADTDAAIAQLSAGTIQLSADTKAAIDALSAGTIQLSADTKATIDALSAGTIQLSADTDATIAELSAGTVHDIQELSAATIDIETGLGDLSAVTLTGVSLNNDPLVVNNHIVSIPVTTSGSGIANATDSGSVADALAVKEYVEDLVSSSVDYKGTTDDVPTGTPAKGDLYIATSAFTVDGKNVEVGDFIIYNGSTWDVIEKNLDGAITGSLAQDVVVLGDGVNSVKYIANGTSGQVLTIANGVPTWVDDIELSVESAGTGNVVSDITVSDHEITFTKGVTAALDDDLQTLSGAVVAKDIVIAQALNDLNDKTDALSAGTIQLSGDVVAYVEQQIEGLDSVGSASTTGHYLTSVTITDGKISAVGEESVPAATPVTTVNGTTGDTASAVLSGIVTGGTDGHQLTLNATNKIFSAETSDSAITSVSAQTSVSAVSSESAITAESALTADMVANALSFSGYSDSSASTLDVAFSYDGSDAKSLTFGTNGNAGLKSMSMTSAGVVDVEVIDCGEY